MHIGSSSFLFSQVRNESEMDTKQWMPVSCRPYTGKKLKLPLFQRSMSAKIRVILTVSKTQFLHVRFCIDLVLKVRIFGNGLLSCLHLKYAWMRFMRFMMDV